MPLFKTALQEPAAATNKETVPLILNRSLVAHSVTKASKDMTAPSVQSEEYKLERPVRSIDKSSSDIKREMNRVMTDLSLATRPDAEASVKSCLIK